MEYFEGWIHESFPVVNLRFQTKGSSNFSISVVAADRKNGFLTQSVAFLLQQFPEWSQIPVISVCNVEPGIFTELQYFVDKLPIHSINRDRVFPYSLNNDDGRIRKEAEDYWSCLKAVHQSAPSDFVLLIEDDALPVPQLGILMDSLLNQLQSEKYQHIDFVKLFHPWRLRKIPFLFQAVASVVALGAGVCFIVFRRIYLPFLIIIVFVGYVSIQRSFYCEVSFVLLETILLMCSFNFLHFTFRFLLIFDSMLHPLHISFRQNRAVLQVYSSDLRGFHRCFHTFKTRRLPRGMRRITSWMNLHLRERQQILIILYISVSFLLFVKKILP